MVFASLTFLYIFLPLNLILYYSFKNAYYRNVLLAIFSLIFYAWGEPVWILLLILTSIVDYLNGLFIERNRGKNIARIGVICSVVFNVSMLMVFKYSQFIVTNLNSGFHLDLPVPKFDLPIGISFYTFQSVSYVVDVYRNKVEAQKSYMKFLMFVSLYHQLVAGPIVRYVHVAHEIDNRKFKIGDISSGITRFCVGLFKKVCVANVAGQLVEKYLHGGNMPLDDLTVAGAWFGVIMFTIQIYFDFSGYSDMAIGLGKMFGFHYFENFNYPYIAKSVTDFWRRWHISLSTWFRDYIYIPLGGNRVKFGRWVFNLFVVWFLTGMWHGGARGACWNFIFWGLFFGILILLERLFLQKFLNKLPAALQHLYLLFIVVMSWTMFYFISVKRLGEVFRIMFGASDHPLYDLQIMIDLKENIFWFILACIFCTPVYLYTHRWAKRQMASNKAQWLWGVNLVCNFMLLFLATSMLVGKSYNPFIYYRF